MSQMMMTRAEAPQRHLTARAVALTIVAVMLLGGVVCAAVASAGTATTNRCGYTASKQGRLGVYVVHGKVSCATAGRLLAGAFTQPGIGLDSPTGWELYKSGWTCQGQMGVYECDYGTRRTVYGLGCALQGCPSRKSVTLADASADNLGVDRCLPARLARSESARSARVIDPDRAFEVIARRARPSDLHWDDLVRNCGSALAHKTWFVVLHPRSQGADSHLFAVPLASGAWVQLGAYSF
jgi:hypothetical protein